MDGLADFLQRSWAELDTTGYVYIFLAAALSLAIVKYYTGRQKMPDVPYLTMSTLPGAVGAAADIQAFVANGSKVMQAGYERVRNTPHDPSEGFTESALCQFSKKGQSFLMRTPLFVQFVAAPHLIEEIRSAPDELLNPIAANNEIMQLRHTLHPEFERDQYQLEVARKPLMQSLGARTTFSMMDLVQGNQRNR